MRTEEKLMRAGLKNTLTEALKEELGGGKFDSKQWKQITGLVSLYLTNIAREKEDGGTLDPETEWQELLEDVRCELNWTRKQKVDVRRRIAATRDLSAMLTDDEKMAVSGLNNAYIANASSYIHVTDFRQTYLGGVLLSNEQFNQFVSSPALRVFSLVQLQEWGISPVTETSIFVTEQCRDDGDYQMLTVRFTPSGRTETVRVVAASAIRRDPPLPFITGPISEYRSMMVYPGSVMDDTRSYWELLSEHYPWDAFQSLVFLLCGFLPPAPAVQARYKRVFLNQPLDIGPAWTVAVPGKIIMAIPVSISVETVTRMYRQIQKDELGRQVHPSELKNLTIFNFVMEKKQTLGWEGEWSSEQWKAVFREWNAAYSEWPIRFPSDLKLDFNRVMERTFVPAWKGVHAAEDRRLRKSARPKKAKAAVY